MKNETNRTKTNVSGIGKYGMGTRTLAIVLGLVMLLTAIGSGSVFSAIAAEGNGASVLLDAAKAGASVDVPADAAAADDKADAAAEDEAPLAKKADSDLADTGRDADIAETGYDYFAIVGTYNGSTNWTGTALTEDGYDDYNNKKYKITVTFNKNDEFHFLTNSNVPMTTGENVTHSTSEQLNYNEDSNMKWNENGGTVTIYINSSGWLWFTGYSAASAQIKGSFIPTEWSSTADMTASGSNYYYSVTGDGTDKYFRCIVNGTEYYPWPENNTDVDFDLLTMGTNAPYDGSTDAKKYSATTTKNSKAFKFTAASGYNYKIWVNSNKVWVTKTATTTYYYLTGYINGTDYSGTSYQLTGSGTSYTYTLASTSAAQYLTVTTNGGETYHPTTHPAANGDAASPTTDGKPTADNKWGITSGANGKNITFTWNPTARTLSWVISSGGTIVVYAKDGAAPINWDNEKTSNHTALKKGAGATGLEGITIDGTTKYLYNYAAIAKTTMTYGDGSAISGKTTTVCDINNASAYANDSEFESANIAVGRTIKITTTINNYNSWRTKYYIAGWCVNGITYKKGTDTVGVNAESDTPTDTGVCTFTYTLPSDTEGMLKDVNDNPVIEITPIYYLRDKTDTVTFYLEGYSDVAAKWGNTPYVYPFYGNLSGYQNTFGVYPGQPIVNVGGQMSIEVPIYTNPIYSSVASTVIKGVTISNGYADHVHRNLVYGWDTAAGDINNDKDHMQTYDYDDFHKIWAERIVNGEHPNAIFFRIKEETKTYNRYTYGGGNSGQFANSTGNLTQSQISAITSNNGWELMLDRHNRPVNIFGDWSAVQSVTPGASAQADFAADKAIFVVSTGYNANIAGDYGTMWKIYNGNGQLLTKAGGRYGIPPSLLNLPGNDSAGMQSQVSYPSANRSVPGVGSYTDANSSYNEVYKALKAATYNNKLVYITYEKDTQDTRHVSTGEGAYRVDGKWFYTHAADKVTSTIGIEYYNRSTGKWVADTVSNAGLGTTTKATAAFDSDSYASSTNKITSNSPLISANASWNFTATESGTDNKYAFSGWYIQYDDTYEHVSGSTNVGTIKATANYHLIARYVPVVTNSLVITHKLDPASTGTGEATMTVKYNNVTQTVNYVNGVANAEINVSWATSPKNIDVTLTAAPQNDGKVQSISVDDQISSYDTNTTTSTLPSETDGLAVSRTLRFTDHDVYNTEGTSLNITELDYVSKIDATPHYYEFTYNFNDRGGAPKKYVTRGEITEDHYAEYVDSSHNVSDEFVKSRAPFESNFMKTLKITGNITKGYTAGSHLLTATANFSATDYTPVYDVKIKLPYNYYASAPTGYKKYNAQNTTYSTNVAPFTLKAKYDEFVTIGATDTQPGAQTKVEKVTDPTDVNHTGNNFLTAPDTLQSGSTTYYFKYWEIKRLADNDSEQAAASVISRIYYPDLNYRFYADSYVEAVYTSTEAEYWRNVHANDANTELSCSVLYLESTRNQWNTNGQSTYSTATTSDVAADKIYNDFIFSYRLGEEEYIDPSKAEIGMVLERVKNSAGDAWVVGDSTVTDMDSYKAANSGTENKTAIVNGLKSGGTLPSNCTKLVWDNGELNNRNYTEQNIAVYSQYGQKVDTHSITFNTNSTMDNFVYRAWAYIKVSNGNVAVNDPAYFSMNFVATQNYSE